MCRTIQSILQSMICALQMITRILMTVLLMVENMIRMLLQSVYNFISTILQIISLLPICCVLLVTAKMKCLLCGGGGGGCGGGGGGGGVIACIFASVFLFGLFTALQKYRIMDDLLSKAGYKTAHRRTTAFWNLTASAWDYTYFRRAAYEDAYNPQLLAENRTDLEETTETETETPTTETLSAIIQPATQHNKMGNLSTMLYYLL